MKNRKYIVLSIKHSLRAQDILDYWLWGDKRTFDGQERCFSGYTCDLSKCELYTAEEFCNKYGKTEIVEPDRRILKKYKKYDNVLIDYETYKKFYNSYVKGKITGLEKLTKQLQEKMEYYKGLLC